MSPEAPPDPIAGLMTEHRLFEHLLGAFEAWLLTIEGGAAVGQALADFVSVFAELVDVHHHGKEEDLLFTAMIDAGFPANGGPLAVMLHEHDIGRVHVHALRAAIGNDGADARRSIVEHGRTYAMLMRAHIQKEDQILYPMAREVLGGGLATVAELCRAYDDAPERRERVAALTGLAMRLLGR
jgi:hemerythrin-like domain-containing protein